MTGLRPCAFLVNHYGLFDDDALAVDPLREHGWELVPVSWQEPERAWSEFDLVVVRTPWDYYRVPDRFEACLAAIRDAGVPMENPYELVLWNMRKTYLRELAQRGVPIVPTAYRDRLAPGDLAGLLAEIRAPQAVVKPVVSASATGAFRLSATPEPERSVEVETYFADREVMAQPLVDAVLTEGEFSLMYFGGAYSHAVLKTPTSGDFRVQQNHGGSLVPVDAPAELRDAGLRVLKSLTSPPLYARIDLVRANGGEGYWLMELELIEPELFLRMDSGAPERWARVVAERGKRG